MPEIVIPDEFKLRVDRLRAALSPDQRKEFDALLAELREASQAALRSQLETASKLFAMVDMTQ